MNDASVLGHLIAVQSMLGSMPNEPRVIEFLCRAISHVPGVENVNACWDSKLLVADSPLNEYCDNCRNIADFYDHPCILSTLESVTSIPLPIQGKPLGFINVLDDTSQKFETFKPHVTNTINVGLIIIENRRLVKSLERENERHFLALVSTIPGVIYRFGKDAEWTVKFLSDPFFELTGHPRSDFLDRPSGSLGQLIYTPDRRRFRRAVAQALTKKIPYIIDYRIVHADGSIRWVHERGQGVFTEQGKAKFLEGALFDITQRKQSEAQLVEARRDAEKASRAKSDFLANISHELRTPLNGILGYAQILQNAQAIPPGYRHHADTIRQSGEYLLALIEDLLDFSRIEAEKLELHKTLFNLPIFLQHIADLFFLRTEEKKIGFEYAALTELPDWVCGDETRLRQVLINLLGNAVNFTDHGKIWLNVRHTGNTAEFEIGDTGIGIGKEDLSKIFEPFEQLTTAGRVRSGTGLGLSIAEKLIEMMDGLLDVRTVKGTGSTFTVKMRLPATSSPEIPERPTSHRVKPDSKISDILVVDDNPGNLKVAAELLGSAGYRVRTAASGRQCLEEANRSKPDIILLDLAMPVMDGFETTRRLRDSGTLDKVIIIALSANADWENQRKSLDAGCNGFVPKPLRLEALFDCLGEHVTEFARPRSAPSCDSAPYPMTRSPLTDRKILVADDNPINLSLLTTQLSSAGATVSEARDGKEALSLIRQKPFDLIMLDLRMPTLNGLQVMAGIQADPGPNRLTRVVAMSAYASPSEKSAVERAGFSAMLTKPVSEETLLGIMTDRPSTSSAQLPPENDDGIQEADGKLPLFVKSMLAKTRGNHGVVASLLEKLFEELPRQQELAKRALLARRYEDARELVHKIHGSATFCEILGLKRAARSLERELSRNSHCHIFDHEMAMEKEIDALLGQKDNILARIAQHARTDFSTNSTDD